MHTYHCGNEIIDRSHDRLEALSRQVISLFKAQARTEDVLMGLSELRFFLMEHFSEEEMIARGVGAPGVALHYQSHQRCLARIDALRAQVRGGEVGDFAGMLDRIFADHEFIDDAMFLAPLTALSGPKTGDLIRWDEQFRVGDIKVDSQHQRLCDIANRLYEASRNAREQGNLFNVLEEFVLAAELHFSEEELLLAEMPGEARRHAVQHRALLEDLRRRQLMVATPKEVEIFCRDFLRWWIIDHIKRCDRPDFLALTAYKLKHPNRPDPHSHPSNATSSLFGGGAGGRSFAGACPVD